MITSPDFNKKQIVFVFFNEGEKLSLSNSNLTVRKDDGSIKFQCTCYRLFLIFAVGHCSVTSALMEAASKFGFFIAMMTPSFRLYQMIGAEKEGNTLLRKKQYAYNGLEIARHITQNKISNQLYELENVRVKSDSTKEAIQLLSRYCENAGHSETLNELMAYEGLASRVYFKNHFNNILWNGRQPRIKRDYINSALDIGYTLLFTYIDALLESYGFDTFCGVMHRQFFMRKSLVCDIVEPFRPLIDHAIKVGINLRQIQEKDFVCINGQYRLSWKESPKYTKLLMTPIIENKDGIFLFIQDYYRAFMKDKNIEQYPVFRREENE